MFQYTLRIDKIAEPKKLDLIMEFDTDNLETIYSILLQNFELWKDNHIINIYDYDAEDGILYHYPEE